MKAKHVSILGIPFIQTTMKDFISLLQQRITAEQKTFVITANPEIVMKANNEEEYMNIIKRATYVTADGIGIVKAAKLLGSSLPERVTGYDMMVHLLELANEHHYRVYFLGAEEDVLERALNNVKTEYPNITIAGSHHGFFDWESNKIPAEINLTEPDLVFVALGVPRQERWIDEHIGKFQKGIFIGVGGSFDVLAGAVERAPERWQKMNLEWLYRLLKQPSRWRRMLALPHFAMKVCAQKVKGKK